MAMYFSGLNDTAQTHSSPISVVPFTMSCWVMVTGNNSFGQNYVMALGSSNSGNADSAYIHLGNSNSLNFSARQNGGGAATITFGNLTPNKWTHIAAINPTTANRQIFVSGIASSISTNPRSFDFFDRIVIGGCYLDGNLINSMTGYIAESAIWNSALTTGEILSLSNGFSPNLVRPQNLIFYTPLTNSIKDIKGLNLIQSGSYFAVYQHPPIYNF